MVELDSNFYCFRLNKYFYSQLYYALPDYKAAGQQPCCTNFTVKPVNVAAYVGDSVSFSCAYNTNITQLKEYLRFEAWNDDLAKPGWEVVFREERGVFPPYNDTYSLSTNNSTTNEFVIDIDPTEPTHAVRHSCFMNVANQRQVAFINLLGETKLNQAWLSHYNR